MQVLRQSAWRRGADADALQGQPRADGSDHAARRSLSAQTDAEAERLFGALAEGGKVQQPLIETFFASRFGMVADRFGVSWMVLVPQEK